MQSKYVRYSKLYRGSFYFVNENWLYVIVYDKYRHCIEMLLIRWNVAYKWRLQRYPYAAYTIVYRDSLYAICHVLVYKQHFYAMPIFVIHNNI
jgi:hypothetical protein